MRTVYLVSDDQGRALWWSNNWDTIERRMMRGDSYKVVPWEEITTLGISEYQ